jgi:hypothetical protein
MSPAVMAEWSKTTTGFLPVSAYDILLVISGVTSTNSCMAATLQTHLCEMLAHFFFFFEFCDTAAREIPPTVQKEGSLPCSQQPATGPYPEPKESNPQLPTLFLSGLSKCPPFRFPDPTICTNFSSPTRDTCRAHLILCRLRVLIQFDGAYNYTSSQNETTHA